MADVWFGFSVFALGSAVFWFWGLPRFAGFLEFSLWFSVFINNDGGFSHFLVQCILRFFLVLPRKLHPAVALKSVSNSKGPYINGFMKTVLNISTTITLISPNS